MKKNYFLIILFLFLTSVSFGQTITVTSVTAVACNGGSDGAIDITSSGFTDPIYSWTKDGNPFAPVTENIAGLAFGTYELTITDSDSITYPSGIIIVSQPDAVVLTASANSVSCNGAADAVITASSTGTGTGTITVDGAAYVATATYGPGTYVVMASYPDGNGIGVCTDIINVTITQPAVLNATVNSTNADCSGSNNGTITIADPTGSGGTYQYRLNNTGTWQNSGSFTGVAPANYSVQIRDAVNTSCVIILNSSLTISIIDTQPPTFNNIPDNLTATCNISEQVPYSNYTDFVNSGGSAIDNIGLDIDSFTLYDETTDGNSSPETVTRIYRIADNCGQTVDYIQIITINDTIPPTASNPAPITASGVAPASDILVVTDEADNCTANPVVAHVSDTPSGSCPETVIRIYSVTDNAGNSINVTQTITVNDAINPIARCVADYTVTLTLDGVTGLATLLASQIDDGSTDNCDITPVLSLDKYTFGCEDIGVKDVTLTVTDSQGNIGACTTKITINAPTIDSGKLEGYIVQTETIADASDVIDMTACPVDLITGNTIQQDVTLNLTVSPALASNINRWEYSINGGVTWSPIAWATTSYTVLDVKVTTLVRAVMDVGDCEEFSPIAVLAVVPPDLPPTIVNGTEMNIICLGEAVTVIVESEFGVGSEVNNGGLFNQANLNNLGWQVDGEAEMSAGGDNGKDTYWKETNGPKELNNRCFDVSDNSKFAVVAGIPPIVNQPNNVHTISPFSTLETPIFSTLGLTTMQLEFDQAYYLEAGAWVKIEISTDGGVDEDGWVELDPGPAYNYTGPSDTGFINPYPGFTGQCKNTLGAVLNDNHVSIDLQQYIGLTNLRIRFTYSGTTNSVWAIDNIQIPNNPVDEVIEWTDDFGVVVAIGSTVNIDPVTPGIQNYGATSLINGCRSEDTSGTEFIAIEATLSYGGGSIVPLVNECGEDRVTLAAYDNTITAQENYDKGVYNNNYKVPSIAPASPNYPGTDEIGTWGVSNAPTSCSTGLPATYIFSDRNDPNATFSGEPGTYTLTWTVNGCASAVDVTINSCSQIDFDGDNDYITFKDNYDHTGPFSIEMWVKPEDLDLTGIQSLLSKRNANDLTTGYDLRLNDGSVQFYWGNNSISSNHIDATTWHHIAVTFNGSAYKLYIDGVEKASQNSNTAPEPNAMECILGAMDQVGNPPPNKNKPVNYFYGWIDELRIWNKALDTEHIRQMMNQEIKLSGGDDVTGEIIPIKVYGPDNTPNNGVADNDDPLLWSNLDGYYRMEVDCGYLTPTKGSLNGRLRNITSPQEETAPLPYTTALSAAPPPGGLWNNSSTWKFGDVWYTPNSIVFGTRIDWNIVEISPLDPNTNTYPPHNINSLEAGGPDGITLLGLVSNSGELTMAADEPLKMDETNSGRMLWITHYLKLDGVIDLVGESQLLQKRYGAYNSSGDYITSQFSESILDADSGGYLERDQQGTGNLYHYNDWSSPVGLIGESKETAFTVRDILLDGTFSSTPDTIAWVGGYDGKPTSPISIADYWIYAYRDFNGDYSNWEQIGARGTLVEGEGYLMKGPGKPNDVNNIGQNYVFKGKPHNGNINLNVAAQNTYLVGNPYPSALDANQFIDDNIETATYDGITGTLYFWEHWGTETHILRDYQAGYAIYTKFAGTPASAVWDDTPGSKIPQRYIPVGQAFYVIGEGLAGESVKKIKFNNNQRNFVRETSGESTFLKSSNSKSKQVMKAAADKRLKIRVAFKIDNTAYRQIIFGVDENTTEGYDIGYDGDIFQIFPDDMYMMLEDKKLVIQAFGELTEERVVPIGIITEGEGIIKIYIEEIENAYPDMEIYIRDNISMLTYDILNGVFEVDLEKGAFNDKYSIVLKNKPLVEEEIEEVYTDLSVYVIENNSIIRISKPEELEIKKVLLFNTIGQEVKVWLTNISENEINLPVNVSTGVYIVVLETNEGKMTKKILIK